jgi:putative Ca2+/H+ antiporter (TMEM165/GDT1 family)
MGTLHAATAPKTDRHVQDELAEAEEELDALDKEQAGKQAAGKSGKRSVQSAWVGAVLKAFSLTFLGEWGDRSQIVTLG